MSNRRFEMYQYRQALVRMRQGDADRVIARSGLMGRKKLKAVRKQAALLGWLSPDIPLPDDGTLAGAFSPPGEAPASSVSSLAPFRERVTAWHAAGVQGTTIHSALTREHGFAGSYSSVRRFLQQLDAAKPPEVSMRLTFQPGEAVQVDFGASPLLTDVHTGEIFKTWFFVMTLCWSRHQYVEMIPDQTVATWLSCHRRAFEWFGGVPGRVIIDNAKCAITKACIHDPEVQRSYAEFAEGYGFRIDPCPPRDPQKKGIVEAGVKYVKRSFLPLRIFRSLADANRQAQEWVMSVAGNRCHGTTREQPLTRFADVERALLGKLPGVPPRLSVWAKVKVHRDAHVQYLRCLYSVPFKLVGLSLWLKATESTLQLYREHELVATHVRQAKPGSRSTVADHMPPEAQTWQTQDTQWCLQEAERIGPSCHALIHALFSDKVLENLRAVQAVLRLAKKVGAARLNAACARAMAFDQPRLRTVKAILANGLDSQAELQTFDALAATYTQGGRFCRDTSSLLN